MNVESGSGRTVDHFEIQQETGGQRNNVFQERFGAIGKGGANERELKVVEGLYLAWHTLRSGAAERGRTGANEDGSRRQSQEDLRELHDGFFIYFESVAARSGIGAAARRELQRQIVEAQESLFSGQ